MRFGLALASDFPPGVRPRDRVAQLLGQVAFAHDTGFDSIWALQHYLGNLRTLQPLKFLARPARVGRTPTTGSSASPPSIPKPRLN